MITTINEFKKHNESIGRSTAKYADDDINYEPEPYISTTVIKFELDLDDMDDLGDVAFKVYIENVAKKHNSTVINFNNEGTAGDMLVATFESPNQPSAFAIIDELYGPEDESRDTNRFYVYGDE